MFEQEPQRLQKHLANLPVSGQNSQRWPNHSRCVILGLYLLSVFSLNSCTFSPSASQSLPPSTAETPQGTASPVVASPNLQWSDLIGVCEGQGAIAAQPYQPEVNSSERHVVFIHRDVSYDGNFNLYDSHLFTRTWQPTQPEKAQLVVCISENKRFEQIESCSYNNGRYTLHRYRNAITVELREANTGQAIEKTTFDSDAIRCPENKPIGDESEWDWSGQLPDTELYTWLKPYLISTASTHNPGRDRDFSQPVVHSVSVQ